MDPLLVAIPADRPLRGELADEHTRKCVVGLDGLPDADQGDQFGPVASQGDAAKTGGAGGTRHR